MAAKTMRNLKTWKTLSTRELLSLPQRLRVSVEKVQLPDDRIIEDYYQIELPEFIVIFAITYDGFVLIERHYKHGVKRVILALPAGYLEPDEKPLNAAKRELIEETGYEADDWHSLGSYIVNGNQGCGKAHLFLATGAYQTKAINSDDLEETEILLMSQEEVIQAVIKGDMVTLGHVTAIALALNTNFIKR